MFQIIATVIAAALVAIDQLTKSWAAGALAEGDIALIDKVLYLRYTENTGVAFSMFSDSRWVLVGLTSLMLIAVLGFFLSGKITGKAEIISLALIMAGGIGNLIDRINLGYVIDFIDFRIINFAIFNVADSCITIGAVLLCISVFLAERKANAQKEAAGAQTDSDDAQKIEDGAQDENEHGEENE